MTKVQLNSKVLLLCLLLSACGPTPKRGERDTASPPGNERGGATGVVALATPGPSPTLKPDAVIDWTSIQFEVIEGEKPTSADPRSVPALADVSGTRDGLVLRDRVLLSAAGQKPLFFAWNVRKFPFPVQRVFYELEVRDGRNQIQLHPEPKPASYDRDTERWFIPLKSVFNGRETDIDPQSQYDLILTFDLSDGSRRVVRIRFLATGFLPELNRVRPIVPLETVSVQTAVEQVRPEGDGWVYRREAYQNPTSRPLLLWIRPLGGRIWMMSHQGSPVYYRPDLSAIVDDAWIGLRLGVLVREKNIRVRHFSRGGWVETHRATPHQWQVLRLEAGETVELGWTVAADPGTVRCPSKTTRKAYVSACVGEFKGFAEDDRGSRCLMSENVRTVDALYGVRALQFEGGMRNEVRLTEEFSVDARSASEVESLLLDPRQAQVLIQPSDVRPIQVVVGQILQYEIQTDWIVFGSPVHISSEQQGFCAQGIF